MGLTYDMELRDRDDLFYINRHSLTSYMGGDPYLAVDGTYIYVGYDESGDSDYPIIKAFSFNGSTYTLEDTINETTYDNAKGICSDGNYIYMAVENTGDYVIAYSFDGSSLTKRKTLDMAYTGNRVIDSIEANDDYIFIGGGDNLRCYTFDGSNFTFKDDIDHPDGEEYDVIDYNDTYIFTLSESWGICAYTMDEVDGLVFKASLTDLDGHEDILYDIYADNNYVYIASNDALLVYTFDGSTFTYVDSLSDPSIVITGDGTYAFPCISVEYTNFFIKKISIVDGDIVVKASTHRPDSAAAFLKAIEKMGNYIHTIGWYETFNPFEGFEGDPELICYKNVDAKIIEEFDTNSKNILSIEVSQDKESMYGTGKVEMINAPSTVKIGLYITITVNDVDIFNGYISDVRTTSEGVKKTTLDLIGLNYLLWRDIDTEGEEGGGEGEPD